MAQSCLKCLKYTMCVANFLCFICGVVVLGLGVYLMMTFKFATLIPSLSSFSVANMLLISGIVITCVSFLGFLGALRENRCLLLTFFMLLFFLMLVELAAACMLLMYEFEITKWLESDLNKGLKEAKENNATASTEWDLLHTTFHCCGINSSSDWGPRDRVPVSCCISKPCNSTAPVYQQGCLSFLKTWFGENFLVTGISVIVLCIIEVLGMCFAMTLFCHISRTGLGYKL